MKSFLRFVTPTDVHDFKHQIDPRFRSVDDDVSKCGSIPNASRQAWDDFSKSWRDFYAEEESWFHATAQMDRAETFEEELTDWQKKIEAYHCSLSAPIVTPESEKGSAGWSSALRWAGVAAGIVGAVWVIRGLRG